MLSTKGTVIEQGPAIHLGGFAWQYRATRTTPDPKLVTVAATARDRLGRTATMTVNAAAKS